MGTSKTAPNDWMIKNGNGKMADNVFAGDGGWYVTYPNGQVELLQAMADCVEAPANPANILSVMNPVAGEYSVAASDVITFKINWTEPVTITGVPRVSFEENGAAQHALYVAGSSSSTQSVFTFDVTDPGDVDAVTTTLGLNGGTVISADDGVTNAVLTFPAGYTQPSDVVVVA